MADNLYLLTFWLSIIFILVGGCCGLLGVWWQDFWKHEIGWRLFMTDMILLSTSVAVAVVTKWLGR